MNQNTIVRIIVEGCCQIKIWNDTIARQGWDDQGCYYNNRSREDWDTNFLDRNYSLKNGISLEILLGTETFAWIFWLKNVLK